MTLVDRVEQPDMVLWRRDDVLALIGIVSTCIAVGATGSLFASPEAGATGTALLLGGICLLLGLAGRMLVVLSLALLAGLGQGLLAAFTASASALWLDDACLPGIVMATVVIAARKRLLGRLALTAGLFLAMSGVAAALAPSLEIAIYQFRQVAVPAILLAAGWTAGRGLVLAFGRFLLAVGLIYLGIMALEYAGLRLVNPWAANGLNPFTGPVSEHNLTRELPPNYYYYVGSERLERAGGLHFNPPGASIFIASLALYAQLLLPPTKRLLYTVLSACGVLATLGRGGGAYLGIALAQRPLSRAIGRTTFGVVVLCIGVALTEFFSSQGNKSDTHTQGLISGVVYALTHPFGSGFGTIGNVTGDASSEGATGESLAGLFLASYGWAGIAALVILLFCGLWLGHTLPGVALTAALIVALFTESASGLALTLPMWFAAGLGLQARPRLIEKGWWALPSPRRRVQRRALSATRRPL